MRSVILPYRQLAIAQLALVLLLAPLIALWPRAGMAVLVLPLPGHSAGAALWAKAQGLPLTGRGIAKGSLILIGGRQYTPFSALGAGALVFAVPSSLCQSPSNFPSANRQG
ncbi:hypothetical protein [Novosphingobium sediminicola]|uniref:Uncharacterized protein n=1 Tax=Novosphingobium sediminicola TaxID=563162 RepID=A0A7W6CHT2_9SPHN|nr:hypothetical protein [Novosphingobium sediminicola]MBB3954623.1 hypothetical protein [Novosphingobium sediminicola]